MCEKEVGLWMIIVCLAILCFLILFAAVKSINGYKYLLDHYGEYKILKKYDSLKKDKKTD